MSKKLEIIVNGRVQGIGYRAFAVKHAQQLSIRGYVRNEADGSVRVLAVGEEEKIEKFVKLLRKGPAFSLVREMDIDEIDVPAEKYQEFRIEY